MDIVRDVHHYLLTDAFDPRSPDKHYSKFSELSQSDCEAIANFRMAQKNKHNLFAAHAATAKRYAKLTGLSDADVERLRAAAAHDDAEHGGKGVDVTLKQRGAQWGDAYKQIAGDWNELLGTELTNEDFIAMMLIMKLRRWANSGYTEQDCLTDIIGYAKLGLSLSDKA